MYYWNKICGFITIFFLTASFSAAQKIKYPLSTFANRTIIVNSKFLLAKNGDQNTTTVSLSNIVSADYYTRHIGFVCKKELAFEKVTKIPLRFRVGSLQQCNYLEGKK